MFTHVNIKCINLSLTYEEMIISNKLYQAFKALASIKYIQCLLMRAQKAFGASYRRLTYKREILSLLLEWIIKAHFAHVEMFEQFTINCKAITWIESLSLTIWLNFYFFWSFVWYFVNWFSCWVKCYIEWLYF